MRARQFITEAPAKASIQNKLNVITTTLSSGQVTDPKTIDYIYKILMKPQLQSAISGYLGKIQQQDPDVAAFQKNNNDMLADVIRKLPVQKEKLDQFVKRWATGKGFVNIDLLTPGNRGTLQQLIPDPTAFIAFETFEKLATQVRLHKRGTAGYGEFGMAMLSPLVNLKAPGDIEVSGNPIEVKGNDARLYSDERGGVAEGFSEAPITQPPKSNIINNPPVPTDKAVPVKAKRGAEPGLIKNVFDGILNNDPTTIENAINAFAKKGVKNPKGIIKLVQGKGANGLETLQLEWWKAGFNSYHGIINMPILVIGGGQFLISDNADDFIEWGCLPKSPSNYGYMWRLAGQSRETYPKIFVPGQNK
jgi:hypothetical protein